MPLWITRKIGHFVWLLAKRKDSNCLPIKCCRRALSLVLVECLNAMTVFSCFSGQNYRKFLEEFLPCLLGRISSVSSSITIAEFSCFCGRNFYRIVEFRPFLLRTRENWWKVLKEYEIKEADDKAKKSRKYIFFFYHEPIVLPEQVVWVAWRTC